MGQEQQQRLTWQLSIKTTGWASKESPHLYNCGQSIFVYYGMTTFHGIGFDPLHDNLSLS